MPRPDNYYDSRLNDQPQPGAVQPSAPVSSGTNNGQATPSTFTQSKLYDNLSENQKKQEKNLSHVMHTQNVKIFILCLQTEKL
mgnify:CR=1 FL=1